MVNDVQECGRVVVTLLYLNSNYANLEPRLSSIPPNEADVIRVHVFKF